MVEAVNAPDGYAKEPDAQRHLDRLREYLQRQYATQPLVNQLYILWASPKDPHLLTRPQRQALLEAIRSHQESDGGWRTTAMDTRDRVDHSPAPTESDGYATGLAVLAMEVSGTPSSDPTLQRGIAWLTQHQQQDGAWIASSINKRRGSHSDAGLFMKDAATAYAVLALEKAE
jgi:hypothetical protein